MIKNFSFSNMLFREKVISITLCLMLFRIAITSFLSLLVSFFTTNTYLVLGIYYTVLIALLLTSTYLSLNRINIKNLLVLMIIFTIFCTSLIIFPENIKYIFNKSSGILYMPFVIFICFSLPCYFLIKEISDLKFFYKIFTEFSYIIIITSILLFLINLKSANFGYSYMTFSYDMLAPTCVLFNNYINGKNKLSLFMGVCSFLLIIVAGARGTILCILFYFVIVYFLNFSKQPKRFMVLLVFFCLALGIIWMNFSDIVHTLRMVFHEMGFNSRTLYYFDMKITDTSGRNILNAALKNSILEHPIIGMGLFGDRLATENLGALSGSYAHNIVYEILSQFGILFGGLILIMIVILIAYSLIITKNNSIKNLILVMLPSGLIKLFLSNSYLQEPYFFVLIGICVGVIENRQKIKEV